MVKKMSENKKEKDPINIFYMIKKIYPMCFRPNPGYYIFNHRLGSTKLADEIIVISEGKAAEIGTFDELMSLGGVYAKMFESQAEWYKT